MKMSLKMLKAAIKAAKEWDYNYDITALWAVNDADEGMCHYWPANAALLQCAEAIIVDESPLHYIKMRTLDGSICSSKGLFSLLDNITQACDHDLERYTEVAGRIDVDEAKYTHLLNDAKYRDWVIQAWESEAELLETTKSN